MTTKKTDVAVVGTAALVPQTKDELLGSIGLTIQDIKNHYAKGATDAELAIFLDQAAANNLDPRKREIYFIKYGNSAGNCITGYQTYIQRADRSGLLDGWTAELLRNNSDAVIAAKVTIHRKDWDSPFTWTVERSEFDSKKSIWLKSPGFMLKKVCIAQAFRLCFPNELGAMPYTSDELSTFTDVQPTDAPPPVADPVAAAPASAPVEAKAAAPAKAKAATKAKAPTAAEKKKAAAKAAEDKLKAKPAPAEAAEPEVDGLDPAIVAKIFGAFVTIGVSAEELIAAAGDSANWVEDDRVRLLNAFKEIKAGSLTKEEFLGASESETVEADEVLPPEVPEAPDAPELPEAPEEEAVEPPADALDPAVVAKILSAFATVGIAELELTQAVGETAMWGESDRVALLASFKELKAGKLTKDAFLAAQADDF